MRYPKNYVVYDTETTGLDPEFSEVVELAAIKVVDGSEERFSTLIKIEGEVPVVAFNIHGISKAECEEKGMIPAEAYGEFVKFVDGLPLIGHNIVRFDNSFLVWNLSRYGLIGGGSKINESIARCVDTAALFKGSRINQGQWWHENHMQFALRIADTKSTVKFNLKHACETLDIDMGDIKIHRAAGDAELAHRLYKKFAE
jgi:DNA polymerase III epsilon subunit-like protein